MDKDKIIIAVTKEGKQIEQLSRENLISFQEKHNILEAKILHWYGQTKDEKFAEFMGIQKAREGRV